MYFQLSIRFDRYNYCTPSVAKYMFLSASFLSEICETRGASDGWSQGHRLEQDCRRSSSLGFRLNDLSLSESTGKTTYIILVYSTLRMQAPPENRIDCLNPIPRRGLDQCNPFLKTRKRILRAARQTKRSTKAPTKRTEENMSMNLRKTDSLKCKDENVNP